MLAVSTAEGVLVVVGLVAQFQRQFAVDVAFLKLDDIRAAHRRHVDQFLGSRHVAIVVLADLGGNTARFAVSQGERAD